MPVLSSKPDPSDALIALLAMPVCAAIPLTLRQALLDGVVAEDSVALRDTPAVMADTLVALGTLDADGEVLAAAILHVAPT